MEFLRIVMALWMALFQRALLMAPFQRDFKMALFQRALLMAPFQRDFKMALFQQAHKLPLSIKLASLQ